MSQIKAYTDAGKVIARLTMGVLYLPEFKKQKYSNNNGFDFTFRSDTTKARYATLKNTFFDTEREALLYKFWEIAHRCAEIQIFDNSLPRGQDRMLFVQHGIVRERAGQLVNLRLDYANQKMVPNGNIG